MAGGWLIGAPATMVCESSAHGVLTVACRLSGAHFSGGWSVDGMAGGWLIGTPATMDGESSAHGGVDIGVSF
jgi:hypothetical protein